MKKQTTPKKTEKKEQTNLIGENLKFTLEIAWEDVSKAYDIVLSKAAENTEIPGFRKGKVPKQLVEEKIGKVKLYDETAYVALQKAYSEEVKKKNLRPIVDPQIKPVEMGEGKTWKFEVETAQAPTVTLGDYKDVIKTAKAKDVIWTPEKGDPKDKKPATDDEKMRVIFTALLESIHIQIPEIILRSEVNAATSRLVQQLERMHMSLEDYLKSSGKTADQLRQEYAASSLATLQLEFILSAIAQEEHIHVHEEEIAEVVKSIEDPEMKKLSENPYQKMQIHLALSKRKTMDFLLSL